MSKPSNPFIQLLKPGILMHSLLTFTLGYVMANGYLFASVFFMSLFGFACLSGGAAAMNHILERDLDALMERTKKRPLPSRILSVKTALIYSIVLGVAGFLILFFFVNSLTAFLGATTFLLYNFIYTPFKKIHWINTYIGAIPGAIPPICGWTSVVNGFDLNVLPFFFIFYFWQMPHFFSIAWLYRDAYQSAGFRMLSFKDFNANKIATHIIINTIFLILITAIPFLQMQLSWVYLVGVMFLNGYYLKEGFVFYKKRQDDDARMVLKASLIYQPLLLVFILLDKMISIVI